MEPVIARKTWRTVEPFHTLVYFAPEAAEAYAALGVLDGPAGYFGSRSAPLGVVPPEVVIATFFNFHPALVRAAIAEVWTATTPEAILGARLAAADGALGRILGPAVDSADVQEAADLARTAANAAADHPEGRTLFAAHAALPWPDEAHLVLWHAQTLLREFRGDAHIAALVAEGFSNVEALITHAATGEMSPGALQGSRAWPADEWQAGVERLRLRGLLAPGDPPSLSEEGAAARQRVEDITDSASVVAYEPLGEDGCQRLRELARPFSRAIVDSGALEMSPLTRPT